MTTTSAPPPRKLKDLIDPPLVRELATNLARAEPKFDAKAFVKQGLAGLEDLELTPRAWHLADALWAHLPRPFPRAAAVVLKSLGPELTSTETFGMAPLRYMPHVFFVQRYGLEHFEPAMQAQYELTKRFSAESSIRAFLVKYPERAYERLRVWTQDENPHVRRLVSEGTRPRLPWAPRLRAFQQDPAPVIALLEILKDDEVRYVQRSIANNLNDIGKDHPELAVAVCERWLQAPTPGRTWIAQHALRSLVKGGHRGALRALGAGGKAKVTLESAHLTPRSVKLGGTLRFSFALASTAKRTQNLIVDYAVHFVKANGAARPKVFKLRRLSLAPGERLTLSGAVSFKDMTTRKHYPGRHRIDALVNGVAYPVASFDVRR